MKVSYVTVALAGLALLGAAVAVACSARVVGGPSGAACDTGTLVNADDAAADAGDDAGEPCPYAFPHDDLDCLVEADRCNDCRLNLGSLDTPCHRAEWARRCELRNDAHSQAWRYAQHCHDGYCGELGPEEHPCMEDRLKTAGWTDVQRGVLTAFCAACGGDAGPCEPAACRFGICDDLVGASDDVAARMQATCVPAPGGDAGATCDAGVFFGCLGQVAEAAQSFQSSCPP